METIRLGIRQKLETEKSSYESLKERFSQLEGVPVCVGLSKQHTSAGGRNEKTHHFDNEAIFLKETSYAVSQDRLWALRFESMPLIIEGSQGDRTFKLKEETLFWVNGNACRLKDILENSRPLPFASLSWEDKNCQLECSLPGNLQVKDGKLYIEFD